MDATGAPPRVTVAILSFTKSGGDPRVLRQIEALRGAWRIVTCGYGACPVGADEHHRIPEDVARLPLNPRGLASLAVRAHRSAYASIPAAVRAEHVLAAVPFDALIANDVECVPAALAAARGRPVIADLHEFAPGQSGDWRWRLAWRPLLESICRRDLPRVSAATTVAPGIAERYLADFGVLPEVVTNAGPYRAPAPRPVGRPLRLVHHGGAQRGRRLERMIDGVGGADGVTLDLYLVRAPRERSHLDELRARAARHANVRVLDPVPMADLPALLDGYDVGLFVLAPTGFNYLHALPNKFFDFVQSGLPVIIGPSPEMQALVERHGLGLVLPDWEAATLRDALATIGPERVAAWQANVCAAAGVLSSQAGTAAIQRIVAASLERGSG